MNKLNANMLEIQRQSTHDRHKVKDLLKNTFNPGIIDVHDCFIIYDEPLALSETTFNQVLKTYGDRTGYEASNNEIRVIDYFSSQILMTREEQYAIGHGMIELLSEKIAREFGNQELCFILSFDESILTIRFHVMREDEGIWFDTDLEKFVEPVEYLIKKLSLN